MASREKRMRRLISYGFLPFEAAELSEVNFKVPYMKEIIRERLRVFNRALNKNWSTQRYVGYIKARYVRKGWISEEEYDPWQMLRNYEHRYKDRNPDYTSPWIKRQKDFRDSKKKVTDLFESQMDDSFREIAEQVRDWREEPIPEEEPEEPEEEQQ